jgi:hypothetical protein
VAQIDTPQYICGNFRPTLAKSDKKISTPQNIKETIIIFFNNAITMPFDIHARLRPTPVGKKRGSLRDGCD